jgi:parallel beta-helix repeat protein
VGSSPSTTPLAVCDATVLPRTPDIQQVLDDNGGNTVCFMAGTYRLSEALIPATGSTLIGDPETILTGAVDISSGWTAAPPLGWWRPWAGKQCQPSCEGKDQCADGTNTCAFPDDVFYDSNRLIRVSNITQLRPGRVWIDYARDRIWMADTPSRHTIEIAQATNAWDSGPPPGRKRVTIDTFIVQRFANDANVDDHSCIDMGERWLVKNVEVRYCHGIGVDSGDDSVVRDSHVHHNGQLGMHGSDSSDVLIEDNEIDHNNTAGYDPEWEAGGSKWAKTTRLTVRGNNSHDNFGPGLWTDIDNIYTVYDSNIVTNNTRAGIFHEISYDATITNNIVTGNGWEKTSWLWGAGILISSSGGSGSGTIEISGNTLSGNADGIALIQQDRGSGDYGDHLVRNASVKTNTVTMCDGSNGAVQDVGSDTIFDSASNHFEANTYHTGKSKTEWEEWKNSSRTWSEWSGTYGNDSPTGTFLSDASC